MAAPVLVNGFPVVRGHIAMPLIGAWHADLVVATQDITPFAQGVLVDFNDGELLFGGTVRRADIVADAYVLRMVGGYDGLQSEIGPKSYQTATLRTVLSDILSETAESLAPDSSIDVLNTTFNKWIRMTGPAHQALQNLIEYGPEAALWRIKPDGDLWVGVDHWPESEAEWVLVSSDPNVGRITVAANIPAIFPGQTVNERKVEYALHSLSPDGFRSTLRLSDD